MRTDDDGGSDGDADMTSSIQERIRGSGRVQVTIPRRLHLLFRTQPHPDDGDNDYRSSRTTGHTSYPGVLARSRQETARRREFLAPKFPALGTSMLPAGTLLHG